MENSNDMRTDGEMPEMDFFIHATQDGMKTGFHPKNNVTGEDILICLAVGIRGICQIISDKIDMPLEPMSVAFLEYAAAVFREDFEKSGGDFENTENDLGFN